MRQPCFLRVLVAALALVLLAAACSSPVITESDTDSGETAPAATEPPTTSTTAPAEASTTTVATTTPVTTAAPTTRAPVLDSVESVVEVIDPGAEPRQELRFAYIDGSEFAFDIAVSQTISQTLNGAPSPVSPPTITTTGQVGTVAAAGDNFAIETTLDFAEGSIEGDPALSAQLQAGLDPIVGLVEQRTIDPTGVVLAFELDSPNEIDPAILGPAALAGENGAALAFPIEPVGVGSTWKAVALLEISGLSVEQVSTYELLGIDGNIVQLAVSTSQFVEPGSAMDLPGAEATVEVWSAEGRGTITVDLTTPMVTSNIVADINQELLVTAGGDEVTIVQQIITETTTTPR